jgi:hypothetical protein
MIRITVSQFLPGANRGAARTKFASIRRISMLRRNIALAAAGANSQLLASPRGGISHTGPAPRSQDADY